MTEKRCFSQYNEVPSLPVIRLHWPMQFAQSAFGGVQSLFGILDGQLGLVVISRTEVRVGLAIRTRIESPRVGKSFDGNENDAQADKVKE